MFLFPGVALPAQSAATQEAPAVQVPPIGAPVLPIPASLSEVFAGAALPADLATCRAMEAHVQALEKKVQAATVRIGGATGVIIPGGYVLTAGHVSKEPDKRIRLTLHDGRRVRAVSLGLNQRTDTGLLRIVSEGTFAGLPLGDSKAMAPGSWCAMFGFPGGVRPGQPAPLRLGRVLRVRGRSYLVSDCCMTAGDSGGPLVDMGGRVIGINSRISRDLANNMHTPVHLFRAEWASLVKGEKNGRAPEGWLGVEIERGSKPTRIKTVAAGSPAATAGLQVGDRVLRVGDRRLNSWRSFGRAMRNKLVGETLVLRIQRQGAEPRDVEIKLARRPSARREEKK